MAGVAETNIDTEAAGAFHAKLALVTMRPFLASDAIRAVQITSRFPRRSRCARYASW